MLFKSTCFTTKQTTRAQPLKTKAAQPSGRERSTENEHRSARSPRCKGNHWLGNRRLSQETWLWGQRTPTLSESKDVMGREQRAQGPGPEGEECGAGRRKQRGWQTGRVPSRLQSQWEIYQQDPLPAPQEAHAHPPAPHQAPFPGRPLAAGDAGISQTDLLMSRSHNKEPLSHPHKPIWPQMDQSLPQSTLSWQHIFVKLFSAGLWPPVASALNGHLCRVSREEHWLTELHLPPHILLRNSVPFCESAWV